MKLFYSKYKWSELFIWIAAIIYLFSINPYAEYHFNFCVYNLLGITWCPGCGLGKSISLILYGDLKGSISTHPLGMFAFIVIVFRIYKLIKFNITLTKTEAYNGKHLKSFT